MSSGTRPIAVFAVAVAAVFFVLSLGVSGVIADDDSDFTVTMETSDAVDGNDDLPVEVTVRNDGNANGTQEIVLTDGNGGVQNSTTVTLDPGEETELTLTWESVPVPEASPAPDYSRSITPKVSSDNSADSAVVSVRWSYFAIEEMTPVAETIEPGESFDISATVRNVGTLDRAQNVTLRIDGSEYAVRESVSIAAEESTEIVFSDVTPDLDPGEHTYEIETADETLAGSLTVLESAQFVIDSLDGVYEDDTAIVEAVVRNEGEVDGEQPVTFQVDGQTVEQRDVSLGAGETTDLTFRYEPDAPPVNATVLTELDADSVRIGEANIEFGPALLGVTPDVLARGESVSVQYTAAGENLKNARLRVHGPDGSLVFETPVTAGTDTEYPLFQTDLEEYREGSYDVTLWVEDEFGRTATTTMEDAFEATAVIDAGPSVDGVDPTVVEENDLVSVQYAAAGTNIENVTLRVEGPDDTVVVEQSVLQATNGTATFAQSDLDSFEEGFYDVTVEITDVFGNTESSTREEAFEATAVIGAGPSIDSVGIDQLGPEDVIPIEYSAVGINLESVTVRIVGPSGESVFNRTVPQGVRETTVVSPGEFASIEEGSYDVVVEIRDIFGNVERGTRADAFEASSDIETGPTIDSVEPDLVRVDDPLVVQYDAVGRNLANVTLAIRDPDGNVVLEGTVPQGVDERAEFAADDLEELDDGPHSVTLEMRDIFGNVESTTVENAFEMAPVYDPDDANFATTESSTDNVVATYEGTAGDFVTVSVSLNEIDDAYILVGGDRAIEGEQAGAPLDILHVDGSATFAINTRLIGTDRPSEEVYIPIDGSVTSYAHSIGADTDPAEVAPNVFTDLRFENEDHERIAETLTEFRAAANSGLQARPLQPSSGVSMVIAADESMVVTEEGLPDARFPLDRANIELAEPSIENVTTYRLPTGNADERAFALDPADIQELEPEDIDGLLADATAAGTVARNDRLLIEVEATGLYGALYDGLVSNRITQDESGLYNPAVFQTLLDRPEGINLEVVHTDPGPNEPGTTVGLFDSPIHEVSVITESPIGTGPSETDRFYVLVDTRPPSPFEPGLGDGEEYEVRMSYAPPPEGPYRFSTVEPGTLADPFSPVISAETVDPSGVYPYLDPGNGQLVTDTFESQERSVEYDRTNGEGAVIVPTDSGATIAGTTNLAPGTDLPVSIVIDVRDDPTTVEIEGVDIAEDGSFEVQADLSMLDAEEEVDIEFWAYQDRIDERPLAVVEDDDFEGFYEVTDLTGESVVTTQGTFVEMATTVRNTGPLADTGTVELVLDGEEVANETIELDAGASRTLNFDGVLDDLEPGQYPLEVRTDDDFTGMILVVEEETGVFEIADVEAESTVENGDPVLSLESTVRNIGTVNATESTELLLDGDVIGERTTELPTGQDVSYTFSNELADLEPGNYTLTVRTPHDEETVNVTLEPARAHLAVSRVDARTTVERGERISPSALITNTGTIADSGTVTARLDGEIIDETLVDLGPAENRTVDVSETTVDLEPGAYQLIIETPDEEQLIELVVEERTDSETTGSEGDDDSGSDGDDDSGSDGDDDGPTGGIAIGAGRRAAIGGTAIVATIHVLGHWV